MLTEKEKERYARQILLPELGEAGQESLKKATVCIVGVGGLGSPVATYLAAAGVGTIRLCDCGSVELSNLNRQFLHGTDTIGLLKTSSARAVLEKLNPDINLRVFTEPISEKNAATLVEGADLVVDCLDNFETRYTLNRCCVAAGKPFLHAGIYGMSGQLSFFHPPETPCLACIFPEAPPPEVFPVLGAPVGVIGSLEALEAIKYLAGIGSLLKNRLLILNGEDLRFDEVAISKDPDCPVCGGS